MKYCGVINNRIYLIHLITHWKYRNVVWFSFMSYEVYNVEAKVRRKRITSKYDNKSSRIEN